MISACGCCERAHQSESTYAQLEDMTLMSRIVAHDRLREGSLENATCARGTRNRQSKPQRVEVEISIVQSVQLGFSRSLAKRDIK